MTIHLIPDSKQLNKLGYNLLHKPPLTKRVQTVHSDLDAVTARKLRCNRYSAYYQSLLVEVTPFLTTQKSRTLLKSWPWISRRFKAGMTVLTKANSNLKDRLSCKCAINWITNPNSVYSHLTCDNIEVATRLLRYN
jgi:hypothetical protein